MVPVPVVPVVPAAWHASVSQTAEELRQEVETQTQARETASRELAKVQANEKALQEQLREQKDFQQARAASKKAWQERMDELAQKEAANAAQAKHLADELERLKEFGATLKRLMMCLPIETTQTLLKLSGNIFGIIDCSGGKKEWKKRLSSMIHRL